MTNFFDTAAEKAKAAFDVAKKKTEEVVTSGKQMIDIASIESKLDKLYEDLGRIYYVSFSGEDKSEEINAKAEEIKTKEAELAAAKEEKAKSGGKVVCPTCGGYTDKKSVYCSKCGAKLGE